MKITYTLTDESPALATYSFLPIVQTFLKKAGIELESVDISLSARILSQFPQSLAPHQQTPDALKALGELVKKPDANLIKTPNISASIPQLKAAIAELQSKGFHIPNFIEEPTNQEEKAIKEKYQKVLGSAVNPILRNGNSDRRCTKAVKNYAKKHPYTKASFSKDSKSQVSFMQEGDFFDNEKAILVKQDTLASVVFESKDQTITLKEGIQLEKNEVLDATFMSIHKLCEFYSAQIDKCKQEQILFSLHLKATMMKVSDPIIFGYAIKTYFAELFECFQDEFQALKINPNNGISEILSKIQHSSQKEAILQKYHEILQKQPQIAMVNSDKGITNLHIPSDVIVDASMPAMLKNGAKLFDAQGSLADANAIIPDKTYATIYQAVLEDMKQNGIFDPTTLGSVANVGLMARKAQEYGSHDKTFCAPQDGCFKIVLQDGSILLSHQVQKGDIYRINQAKYDAIINWIDLGIERANLTGSKAIFWLDAKRPNNQILIDLIQKRLKEKNADIEILPPKEACFKTLAIIRKGEDCISITGNVLRDYLTDLFPILELGTSAKMLSVVPMLSGGAMFETGAGGSAPKQVEQLLEQNHLRWDSLGEFLALQASLEFYAQKNDHKRAKILAECLDRAIAKWLMQNKAPSRKPKENDNRTSHFYLALYLSQELAQQNAHLELQSSFKDIAEHLTNNESTIFAEYMQQEGQSVDLGGYYKFDDTKARAIMLPSQTFNAIFDK